MFIRINKFVLKSSSGAPYDTLVRRSYYAGMLFFAKNLRSETLKRWRRNGKVP